MKQSWQMTEPHKGAHIRVRMSDFYHHGIYIGDDEVVQFGLPSDVYSDASKIRVMRSPLKDFCGTASFFEVYCYSKKEKKLKRADDDIVKTALSKVGEGNYNIINNNCEHFASFCVFGKSSSPQIDQIYSDVAKFLSK